MPASGGHWRRYQIINTGVDFIDLEATIILNNSSTNAVQLDNHVTNNSIEKGVEQ